MYNYVYLQNFQSELNANEIFLIFITHISENPTISEHYQRFFKEGEAIYLGVILKTKVLSYKVSF